MIYTICEATTDDYNDIFVINRDSLEYDYPLHTNFIKTRIYI